MLSCDCSIHWYLLSLRSLHMLLCYTHFWNDGILQTRFCSHGLTCQKVITGKMKEKKSKIKIISEKTRWEALEALWLLATIKALDYFACSTPLLWLVLKVTLGASKEAAFSESTFPVWLTSFLKSRPLAKAQRSGGGMLLSGRSAQMKRRGEGNICGLLNETPPCCEPSGLRNHCAALFANEHGHSHRITFKCSKSLE